MGATAFISSAVAHCQPVTNQQALCASGVAGLTGALTGMSKSILNTWGACERDPIKKITSPKYKSAEAVTAWNDYTGNKFRGGDKCKQGYQPQAGGCPYCNKPME